MTDKELLARIVALLSTQTAQLERIASACERCEMRTLKGDGVPDPLPDYVGTPADAVDRITVDGVEFRDVTAEPLVGGYVGGAVVMSPAPPGLSAKRIRRGKRGP